MVDFSIPGYEDLTPIGRGGSATVYRARQTSLGGRDVAIKVIADVDLDADTRRRFERECAAAGQLSWHPNVVSTYDAGVTDDNRAYLVMEYLPNGSLGTRLGQEGPLPWQDVADIGAKIADALAAAHEVGLIHRDVKPENILVSPRGEPMLGDFGIAYLTSRTRGQTAVVATVAHAAPEILAGARPDERADIYSLGSTLYTLLAGKPAFVDDTDESIVTLIGRIATAPIPDLREQGSPDWLFEVIGKAMAKEPSARWTSAEAFATQLSSRAGSLTRTAPIRTDPPDTAGAQEITDISSQSGGPRVAASGHCIGCGAPQLTEARFCQACGTPVQPASVARYESHIPELPSASADHDVPSPVTETPNRAIVAMVVSSTVVGLGAAVALTAILDVYGWGFWTAWVISGFVLRAGPQLWSSQWRQALVPGIVGALVGLVIGFPFIIAWSWTTFLPYNEDLGQPLAVLLLAWESGLAVLGGLFVLAVTTRRRPRLRGGWRSVALGGLAGATSTIPGFALEANDGALYGWESVAVGFTCLCFAIAVALVWRRHLPPAAH